MRENNNTQFRHEQFVLKWYFKEYAPNLEIELEYPIYSENRRLIGIMDLADLTNKIAWRLHGEIHQGIRAMRDEEQEQELILLGWNVINCHKDSWNWAWLWKKN